MNPKREIEVSMTGCADPTWCRCERTGHLACGYRKNEIRERVVEYYKSCSKIYENMTDDQFFKSLGFYHEVENE
jgi:hypothetical protein